MPKKIPPLNKTHTLIISDIHLGSSVSRSKAVYKFLENFKFKKLILLGDIFESLNFNGLEKDDWKFLSLLSEFSKHKKIRWIEGNHDVGLTKIFGAFTGAKIYKSYKWHYNNKKYLAIHGHQFDNFLINNMVLSFLINKLYNFIQLIDFKDKRISRFIKNKSKGWLRLSKKVAHRAILYAKLRNVQTIFCGHTHKALYIKKRDVSYYNSGCWTDVPSTYITIDKDGAKIHKYF